MLPFNGHQSCWVITAIHKVYALLHWASPGATCAHFAGAGVGVEGGGAAMTPLCVKLTTSAWGHMPLAPKCVIFYAAFCVAHSTDRHREGDSKRERDREREKEREIDSEADSDRYWRRPLSGILSTLGQLPKGFYDSSLKMQTEKERERGRGRVVNVGRAASSKPAYYCALMAAKLAANWAHRNGTLIRKGLSSLAHTQHLTQPTKWSSSRVNIYKERQTLCFSAIFSIILTMFYAQSLNYLITLRLASSLE